MRFFAVFYIVCVWSGVASADRFRTLEGDAQAIFEEAKKVGVEDPDLAKKKFRRAGEVFALAAEKAGDPGAAHYNAGNAFLFSGQMGEAVFHYRMAQIYHPFDANVAHNLESARMQVLDSVIVQPKRSIMDLLATAVRFVPAWARISLFALGYLGLFAVLGVAMFRRRQRWQRNAGIACAGVAIIAGLTLVVEWWVCQGGRDGVIAAEEVVVRTGDGEVYPWAFTQPLHAGVEFRILESRGDWIRVRLWSGDEGWLRADGVRVVGTGI